MINFRQAVKEDSADIARLFLISSDGLAEYIWSKVAEPGETVIEAGAHRYAREGVAFSYESGKPLWVTAHQARASDWDPIWRTALTRDSANV